MFRRKKKAPAELSDLQKAKVQAQIEAELTRRVNEWLQRLPMEALFDSIIVPMIVRKASDYADRHFVQGGTDVMEEVNRHILTTARQAISERVYAELEKVAVRISIAGPEGEINVATAHIRKH